MARRKFESLPSEKRLRILGAAAEEFAKNGYHAASYNRILERAGLGKSSAYYYFEDKADLFVTAVAACYDAFFASVTPAAAPKSVEEFWELVTERNLRGMRFVLEDPTSAALMQCLLREGGSLELSLGAPRILDAVERCHAELVQMGRELGAVRCDLPIAELTRLTRALAASDDQAFLAEVRCGPVSEARMRELAAEWTDHYRRLLRPEPRKGRRPRRRAAKKKR